MHIEDIIISGSPLYNIVIQDLFGKIYNEVPVEDRVRDEERNLNLNSNLGNNSGNVNQYKLYSKDISNKTDNDALAIITNENL